MEKVDIQPTNEGLATTLLPIDLRVAVSKTLRYYGLLSGTILNYVLKKESAQRLGKVALAVCWIIVARQFTLLFSRFDDVQLWLGFPMGIDKKAYVTVGILVWSIYAGLVMRLFYEGQHLDVRGLNWLQPLQVRLSGFSRARENLIAITDVDQREVTYLFLLGRGRHQTSEYLWT